MPSTVPTAEATTPTITDSATIMRMTCLRLEPMARSIAVSLVRCATVIEKALKITNPPTTRATTANTSRNVLMNDMPWCAASMASATAACPVITSTPCACEDAASAALTRAASADCVTPAAPTARTLSMRPGSLSTLTAVAGVNATTPAPPASSSDP